MGVSLCALAPGGNTASLRIIAPSVALVEDHLAEQARPRCSHGFTRPHTIGGTTGFHYDVAVGCDEWAVEKGLYVDRLKSSARNI